MTTARLLNLDFLCLKHCLFSRLLWGRWCYIFVNSYFLCSSNSFTSSNSLFLFFLFVLLPPFMSHILSFSFLFLLQLVVLSLSLLLFHYRLFFSISLSYSSLFLSSSVISLSFFFCPSVCFSLIFFSLCLSSLISNAGPFTRVGKFLLWSNLSKITFLFHRTVEQIDQPKNLRWTSLSVLALWGFMAEAC